jgi:hypothetical protein
MAHSLIPTMKENMGVEQNGIMTNSHANMSLR